MWLIQPDVLENKFGGNPNNGADASSTLSVLLNNVYTLNQIRDLRPGSTMIEVVDGYAQLGLTLQELRLKQLGECICPNYNWSYSSWLRHYLLQV